MTPKLEADLICLEDGIGVQALRATLEYFGVRVNYLPVGAGGDFIRYLGAPGASSAHVIIAGHGLPRGFCLDELAPGLAAEQKYNEVFPAEGVLKYARLGGKIVVSDACYSGNLKMANAFLARGATAYLAPDGAPEGDAALIFLQSLYYYLMDTGLPLAEASAAARALDKETAIFSLRTGEQD